MYQTVEEARTSRVSRARQIVSERTSIHLGGLPESDLILLAKLLLIPPRDPRRAEVDRLVRDFEHRDSLAERRLVYNLNKPTPKPRGSKLTRSGRLVAHLFRIVERTSGWIVLDALASEEARKSLANLEANERARGGRSPRYQIEEEA